MELNYNQKAAIQCIDKNLQIVACAGSGKTEVITRRIVNILLQKKDVNPENIVAFTFTEKAAENMIERIKRNVSEVNENLDISSMYVGTIHSFCRNILDKYVPEFAGFRILDTVKEHLFIMKYFNKCGAKDLGLFKRDVALFSNCIDKMVSEYDLKSEWPETVSKVFEQYKALLYEKKFITFPLLIHEVLLHAHDSRISDYFDTVKYLIVDEYQDVDDVQEKLIKYISYSGANICVVGDDDQTIYQFRGSNADNMINFAQRYNDVVTINLDTNYRSTIEIIDVADKVVSHNVRRLSKSMRAGNESLDGFIRGGCFEGIDEEYDMLIQDIQFLSSIVNYSDMAILIRKRKHLSELTKKLSDAGIPYCAEESDEFFESDYYEKFCNVFKYLENPSDDNKQVVINDWLGFVDNRSLKDAIRYLTRCSEINEKFVVLFNKFSNCLKLDDDLEYQKYAEAFCEILNDFDQVYTNDSWTVRVSDVNIFIENMVEDEYQRTELIEKSTVDAIKIMTVHQSKGLEFEAVFIPDLQKGFFPAHKIGGKKYYTVLGGVFEENKEKYEGDIEDERKLFYVALTRAKRYLYVYADIEKKTASEFMIEMNDSSYCDIDIPIKISDIYDLRAIRKALREELHGAAFIGGYGGAFIELNKVKEASEDELLELAKCNGINIELYKK